MDLEKEWVKTAFTGKCPPSSFGHTATPIGKTKVVLFGGALEVPGKLTMTNDIYIYNVFTNEWCKCERKYIILINSNR